MKMLVLMYIYIKYCDIYNTCDYYDNTMVIDIINVNRIINNIDLAGIIGFCLWIGEK